MNRFLILIACFIPVSLFGLSESQLKIIEKKVFEKNTAVQVKALMSDSDDEASLFQNALVHYRLGNLLTNKSHADQSLSGFNDLLLIETNVYYLCYAAMAHGSQAMFKKSLKSVKTTLSLLSTAIEMYPTHYMPRFYRGMMYLFIPGIAGGDKVQGKKDMEKVISQVEKIDRDGDYKAMVYFIYGLYWEKSKEYTTALIYLDKARSKTTDEKMREALDKKEEEWKKKIK